MTPLASTIIFLVAKYGPQFVESLIATAHAPAPTAEDWTNTFALAKNNIADVGDMPSSRDVSGLPTPE